MYVLLENCGDQDYWECLYWYRIYRTNFVSIAVLTSLKLLGVWVGVGVCYRDLGGLWVYVMVMSAVQRLWNKSFYI